jgi:hypothetical protein
MGLKHEGLLHVKSQAALVKVLEENGKYLCLPKKKAVKLPIDLVVERIAKDEMLLCLKLLEMA